jgi:hypothetical protein
LWIASFEGRLKMTPTAGGLYDKCAAMDRMIESIRTHTVDCGCAKFELFNRIVADRTARLLPDRLMSM